MAQNRDDMSGEKKPNVKRLMPEGWNTMTVESCEPSVSKNNNAMKIVELHYKTMNYTEKVYLVSEPGKRWQLKKLLDACGIEAGKDGIYDWNDEDIVGKEINVLNEPEDNTWIDREGNKQTRRQNRFTDFEPLAWDQEEQ